MSHNEWAPDEEEYDEQRDLNIFGTVFGLLFVVAGIIMLIVYSL